METRPLLIVGALKKEVDYLIQKIEDCKICEKASYIFYEGKINNFPVVLVRTGIGLINASSAVTLAIEKYNPIAILNQGTAGGITVDRHKKDIVIATETFNINSYKSPYKEIGEGSDSRNWELVSFFDGAEDEKISFKSDSKLIDIAYSLKEVYKKGNVFKGIVGSGDAWNREKDRLKFLDEKHNVSCEDMEAVAIYAVAKNYELPVLSIKIMSDNELLGEEYEPDVAYICQEFAYEVILKICDYYFKN